MAQRPRPGARPLPPPPPPPPRPAAKAPAPPPAPPAPPTVEEPYNPFQHRNVKKPTSTFGALVHLLKTSLGSGILAMAMAFKNAGLVFGAVGTIFIGIVCTHCIYMLIDCAQKLCVIHRVPSMSYSETTVMSFRNGPKSAKKSANVMGILTTTQILLSFILGSSVYVVFMAHSMSQFVEYVWDYEMNSRYFTLILWIPLILVCMLRTLKALVPLSIIANLCVLLSFSIVLYYLFRSVDSLSSVNMISSPDKWPIFLASVVFAIEGIGTVMSIENEMKNPQNFLDGRCGILFIAMTIVVVLYTIIGFFGYLEYKEEAHGSITLDLPVEDVLAEISKISIAVSIFLTYPLQFYVPIKILFDILNNKLKPKRPMWLDFGVRVTMVTLTVIMALAIPNLEHIIGLVGAVCFSILGLLFPALIDIMTRHPKFGRLKWRLVKNILISMLSIFAVAGGTVSSMRNIIQG